MINEMRSYLMPPPPDAGWADASVFAREGNEKVIAATVAANARKSLA
jgi:hypothetical protein